MNKTYTPEAVSITVTLDNPAYNSQVMFNSLDGQEFLYYNTPSLYPGDTAALTSKILRTASVRAILYVEGLSLRQLDRHAITQLEHGASALCNRAMVSCAHCKVEQIRNGDYVSSTDSSTGSTTVSYGGDFFGGSSVAVVLGFEFSMPNITTPQAFGPLVDFMNNVSTIRMFGDVWRFATGISSPTGLVPSALEESPVVSPQIGTTQTVSPKERGRERERLYI